MYFFALSFNLQHAIVLQTCKRKSAGGTVRVVSCSAAFAMALTLLLSSGLFSQTRSEKPPSKSSDTTTAKSPVFSLPTLEVLNGSTYDFGDVYRGQKVNHQFTLRNAGNDTLRISRVSASCGCTAAIASTDVVPPQGRADINATFNSEGYGGRVSKYISVTSNDPVNPTQQLVITGNVLAVLEFSPLYFFIQRAKVDSVSSGSIEMKNTTSKSLRILSVEPKLGGLQAFITKDTLKPGEAASLRVSYKPKKEGPVFGTIELKTDFPFSPRVSVQFTANAFK